MEMENQKPKPKQERKLENPADRKQTPEVHVPSSDENQNREKMETPVPRRSGIIIGPEGPYSDGY